MSDDEYEQNSNQSHFNINGNANLQVNGNVQNPDPPVQPQVDFVHLNDDLDPNQFQNAPLHGYINLIYAQLLRVTIVYGALVIYSITQIGLSIIQMMKHYQLSPPIQIFYLMSVMLQFIFHSYYCSKQMLYAKDQMDQTREQNECPPSLEVFISQEVVVTRSVRFWSLWEFISNRELSLSTINNILYFWMFTLGNLVYVSKSDTLDRWYLNQLLFPGWIVALITSLLFALLCLAFPVLVCYSGYIMRMMRRRRHQRMQRAIPQPVTYETLVAPSGQPCYICLTDFEPMDMVIQLRCHRNHVIHDECLRPWLAQNTVCPICRKEIM